MAIWEPSTSAPISGAPYTPSPAITVLTGSSGPGAACLPSSVTSAARSATPLPVMLPPPASSGASSAVQPASAARAHHCRSKALSAWCSARRSTTESS
nr:hypothetical protein [Mycobacterium adipatum]